MSERFRYDWEALTKALERDKSTLIGTYDKITKRTMIHFKCHCGEEGHKGCIHIIRITGALCKKCTLKNNIKKLQETRSREKKVICNTESLQEVMTRDNAILLETYEVVTINTPIHFKCNCGEYSIKNCLQLIKVSGAFCKGCTRKTWTQHQKETNLEKYGVECTVHATHIKQEIVENNIKKYGVENVFQSPEIRDKIKQTFINKYGVTNINSLDTIKQKIKNTNIIRYGGENPMYSEEVKHKQKNTILERYGVEYTLMNPDIKQKAKNTCLERYGVEHVSQTDNYKQKVKKTFMERFGVDNPNKTKEVRDKIKKTCLERYGVENASQNADIMQKAQQNARKYKQHTMPSGTIRKVQGYEPFALHDLLKSYKEDDIKTDRKDIPRIAYQKDGKDKYYFPDIYLPSTNTIIEVKSTWTYRSKTDNIIEKEDATKAAGYNYDIWIYDAKGNRMEREKLKSIVP